MLISRFTTQNIIKYRHIKSAFSNKSVKKKTVDAIIYLNAKKASRSIKLSVDPKPRNNEYKKIHGAKRRSLFFNGYFICKFLAIKVGTLLS